MLPHSYVKLKLTRKRSVIGWIVHKGKAGIELLVETPEHKDFFQKNEILEVIYLCLSLTNPKKATKLYPYEK